MPENEKSLPAIVYVGASIRNGKIVQGRRGSNVCSLLVEFDTAGIPREWMLEGQCFTKDKMAELINHLREDAKYLNDKADAYEQWLERQAIQST